MQPVIEFFKKLFDDSDWPARWHCGRWTQFHGWLYIISDLLIWSAYFSIPLVILKYVLKKQGLRFVKLYFLFAAFILACGSTHFLDAIAFWIPAYRLNALTRLITGILSWATIFYLVRFLPVAFSLKSQKELEAEIEQRQKAEELERESKAQIQTIFNAAPDAVIVMDEEGKITNWNPRAEALFGWTAPEVINRSLGDLIIPHRYREAHKNGLDRYMKTGETSVIGKTIELQALRKDDKEFDVSLSISPAVMNNKRLFIGFVRDITEQKKVQEEIKKLNTELEQRVAERTQEIADYKYALDESAIVAITDQKGIIRHVNENFCRISKYNAGELIGHDHRIINSGYHSHDFISNLWVTIANGKIWKGEIKNKAKDGSFYWVDTTIVPFLNDREKPFQYVAIRSDITARKKAEEELRKLNEELEDRIAVRTIQLESANREMEAFSYSVSHDLRAPLRGIVGFVSILEEDYSNKLDDEAKRITSVIKNNTLKMGHLIDDLLDFSRIARQDVMKMPIDTMDMVKDIIRELNPDRSSIEWTVHRLPSVMGDINAIRQVWINLISNAIKYSGDRKKPRIEIGSLTREKQIAFFVKDNGVGFDNKYRDKLFRVFQRLHSAEQFEGTGVGLALVEKIVSKHGGRVWADAEIDKGATFYFSLPDDGSRKGRP